VEVTTATQSSTLGYALMAHQEEGVAFLLANKGGLLAFEQGLGKTLVAIIAFARARARGDVDAMLVICPNSLKRNWVAEFARFAPEVEVGIVEGPARLRRREFARIATPVVVVSYETARAEVAGVLALLARRRTALVLDESHTVKNRASLTSIAARHFAPRCEYRWLLTGTPVTNTAVDLHTQLAVVAAGEPLGTLESFVASYGDNGRLDTLRARVAPYLLRRTKDECLDLPAKTFVDMRIELPPWQRHLYNSMRDELVCEVRAMSGEEFRAYAPTALARLLRLSQIASNPALLLPTEPRVPAKFEEMDHLLEEIIQGGGDKVIIWSHYVGTLEALLERYRELSPVALYGGTLPVERQGIARRFQEDPKVRLLIGNPAAGGSGFTLTAARYAIYETLSWRYDFYAQSQDRIHRIGQGRPVTYIRLLAADTVEEVIAEALARKAALARALLGDAAGATAITALSVDDFCAMLTSNRIPVGPAS
jgi:SNF2 family DNA or RNA helicase